MTRMRDLLWQDFQEKWDGIWAAILLASFVGDFLVMLFTIPSYLFKVPNIVPWWAWVTFVPLVLCIIAEIMAYRDSLKERLQAKKKEQSQSGKTWEDQN